MPFLASSDIWLYSSTVRRVIPSRESPFAHGFDSTLWATTLSPTSVVPWLPMPISACPALRIVLERIRLRLAPLTSTKESPVLVASLPKVVIVFPSIRLSLLAVGIKGGAGMRVGAEDVCVSRTLQD